MTNNRLYVGNLSYGATDQDLSEAFGQYGRVVEAKVVMDRDTGRSKGFAFVTMETPEAAQEALRGLNGQDLAGRTVRVDIAESRERSRGGGFGGGSRTGRFDGRDRNDTGRSSRRY